MATQNVLGKSPVESVRLPGGLFVLLGTDQYNEFGDLQYPGKLGIKFGREKTDWVRMTYSDAVLLYRFLEEHKDFINSQVRAERDRFFVDEI